MIHQLFLEAFIISADYEFHKLLRTFYTRLYFLERELKNCKCIFVNLHVGFKIVQYGFGYFYIYFYMKHPDAYTYNSHEIS